jgi:hypothetical protein
VFERLRHWVLRALRVPPEPDPPFGEPSSLRVFRASRKLYLLRLIGWGAAQIGAFLGILFWLGVLMTAEHEAKKAQADVAAHPSHALRKGRNRPASQSLRELAARVPNSVFVLLWAGKGLGVMLYLGQLAVTYAAVRLDYEMRWYLVTDRSLRIRSGLWKVEEMTMSFANLQQVVVSQGPLQRWLGIADVQVESAGGGGGGGGEHGPTNTMHTGVFHGVEQAVEIRDLILNRLRSFRETGLGDPDEPEHGLATSLPRPDDEAVSAARELLAEVRQLRQTVERSQ